MRVFVSSRPVADRAERWLRSREAAIPAVGQSGVGYLHLGPLGLCPVGGHNRQVESPARWVGFIPHSIDNLPPETQAKVRKTMRERSEQRGRLLAVVEVRVFERDEHAQVSFTSDSALTPDADPATIAEVVTRARKKLTTWR